MKISRYNSLILIILLFTLLSCSQQQNHEVEHQNLMNSVNAFYEAVNNGDIEKRITLFSTDALMLPNNGELIHVDSTVTNQWRSWDKDWVFRLKDIEHVEIDLSGDIAYTINTYYYTFHAKDSEPEWHKTKNVHIWKKQNDGSWKLHVDIWNSSVSQ